MSCDSENHLLYHWGTHPLPVQECVCEVENVTKWFLKLFILTYIHKKQARSSTGKHIVRSKAGNGKSIFTGANNS